MRAIGFYGWDDWRIRDCQLSDLDALIKRGQIRVVEMLPDTREICLNPKMEPVMKNSIIRGIDFKTIENLQQAGFVGFIPIGRIVQLFRELRVCIWSCAPRLPLPNFSNKARADWTSMYRSTNYVQIG